jgi:hypothetical protein
VILSWLSNKSNIAGLRSELRAEVASLRAEIGILRAGMNGLRKEIYEALIPLHERMAIIEIKQK